MLPYPWESTTLHSPVRRAGTLSRCGCRARCRARPAARHWLWVWMGDPALADPDHITDFHWLDDPNWGAKGCYLHVKANWQLIIDNLLDLTHLAFVHESTIGNAALVENAAVKVTRAPNNVV